MSPEPKGQKKVHPDVRRDLGDYHATGIEAAFNSGVPVLMPPIEGFSPTIQVREIDMETSISNILKDPTDEEKKRWVDMTPEEIRADIEEYVREL